MMKDQHMNLGPGAINEQSAHVHKRSRIYAINPLKGVKIRLLTGRSQPGVLGAISAVVKSFLSCCRSITYIYKKY